MYQKLLHSSQNFRDGQRAGLLSCQNNTQVLMPEPLSDMVLLSRTQVQSLLRRHEEWNTIPGPLSLLPLNTQWPSIPLLTAWLHMLPPSSSCSLLNRSLSWMWLTAESQVIFLPGCQCRGGKVSSDFFPGKMGFIIRELPGWPHSLIS